MEDVDELCIPSLNLHSLGIYTNTIFGREVNGKDPHWLTQLRPMGASR
jgi:hypothetical protein